MTKEKVYIFDTTLRDGAQTQGVDFSIDDKLKIASALDSLGVDYIEGGWPGANPTDTEFFQKDLNLKNSILTAFGMTKKTGRSAENDPGIAAISNCNTRAVCLVGKAWDFHVDVALEITNEENLENIVDSTKHFVKEKKDFMFDAEHFFDGYKSNPEYSIDVLRIAHNNGAERLILCDTNGGTLPSEIYKITKEVTNALPKSAILGIHTHNDTDTAVASSLAAYEAGAIQIQGCVNGYGERTGNANIVSIIGNLKLKMNIDAIDDENVSKLTELANCLILFLRVSIPDSSEPLIII
mgnify:CR=1 FL=1